MALNTGLLAEFKHETENSRKILARVPVEKFSWKPHEKSMTLEKLATHIADLPSWVSYALTKNELDFASNYPHPPKINTSEELLALLDKNSNNALAELEKSSDAHFMEPWTLRNGEKIFFTMSRIAVVRGIAMNHIVHHRGQLSVYLRLLDVPVPGIYGPSADENM